MRAPTQRSPLDYVFVLRPALMPPVWTIFLLGNGFRATHLPEHFHGSVVLGFCMLTCLSGAVYLLNQYFDVESDRQNNKLHFFPLGLISKRAARLYYAVLNVMALALATALSLRVLLVGLILIVLGVAYSADPWRWKDRAYPALLANAAGHGTLVFLVGWFISAGKLGEGLLNSLPYFFAVGAIYILTSIPDTEGDEAAGKRTLAVVLGRARAARWALGWYWASVLLAFWNLDLLFVIAALPLAYLFIKAAAGGPEAAIRAVRWAVGLLSLVACLYFPWYLAVLVVGYLLTRRYYRWRFDLAFP
jgi:4-hydroxybenzoate polyprenyltransferase